MLSGFKSYKKMYDNTSFGMLRVKSTIAGGGEGVFMVL